MSAKFEVLDSTDQLIYVSAYVSVKSKRLLSVLLSNLGNLRVKLVLLQFIENGKLQTNLQEWLKQISSSLKARNMLALCAKNLLLPFIDIV